MSQANLSRIQSTPLSKEDMLAAIRECAEKLGHVPSLVEFQRAADFRLRNLRKHFGTYTRALREAGLEPRGSGHPITIEALFADWAELVRKLGKVPTVSDYEVHSKYSVRPLTVRFGSWNDVSLGLLLWAQEKGMEGAWGDVLDVVRAQRKERFGAEWMSKSPSGSPSGARYLMDRPTFGTPLMPLPLAYAPTNEIGVVYLFGMMAAELGFVVIRLQAEFPDCKAMRRVDKNCWQEVWIEFEFESRNFLAHMHNPEECDLVVCWEHNWPECPLEVLELKTALSRQQSAFSPVAVK